VAAPFDAPGCSYLWPVLWPDIYSFLRNGWVGGRLLYGPAAARANVALCIWFFSGLLFISHDGTDPRRRAGRTAIHA
jgi:hypothetical protein